MTEDGSKLKPCGCCEGVERLTPQSIVNRAGLDELAYRAGTHARFLETMVACLSSSDYPALARLTTREASDPAIALLDAWATVGDVLTFYQERIANEGYLGTATERRSILELARLVGYKLRPGVAASVYLAFELEEGRQVEIPAGTRAQSLPGPDEEPQFFETSEPLLARAGWNEMEPRLTRPQFITGDMLQSGQPLTLCLQGANTGLQPNDMILLAVGAQAGEGGDPEPYRVLMVEPDPVADRTEVTIEFWDAAGRARIWALPPGLGARVTTADLAAIKDELVQLRIWAEQMLGFLLPLLGYRLPSEQELRDASADQILEWLNCFAQAASKIYSRLSGGQRTRLKRVLSPFERLRRQLEQLAPKASFTDIVQQLKEEPALQPASARHLRRDLTRLFGERSDMVPRLLSWFHPELAGKAYVALGNIQLGDAAPAMLQRVEALRVKAAPFGHNAPLRPVFDAQGVLKGHDEWPLSSAATIGIELNSTGNRWLTTLLRDLWSGYALRIQVSLEEKGHTWSELWYPQGLGGTGEEEPSGEITLGRAKVTIIVRYELGAVSEDNQTRQSVREIEFKFSLDGPEYVATVSGDPPQDPHVMSVDIDGESREVAAGQFLRFPLIPLNEHELDKHDTAAIEFSGDHRALIISQDRMLPLATEERKILTLDAEYDQITPGSWVVIEGDHLNAYQVQKVETVSPAKFGITGEVTQLTLVTEDGWLQGTDLSLKALRSITVYAQCEPLGLADEPIDTPEKPEPVAGDEIELDGLYDGLEPGRWLIVAGERVDIGGTSGVMDGELGMIDSIQQKAETVLASLGRNETLHSATGEDGEIPDLIDLPGDKPHTVLRLAGEGLAYQYKRDTVKIYGNVAKATHGETRDQVLGSGDGSQALQSFPLAQSPLTYVAVPTAAGAESTLEVRVNKIQWHEKDNLTVLGPRDRGFITQTDNEDVTTAIFGDGQYGARLPTGDENVTAVYRKGIGQAGNVKAGQISQLVAKPLGVKGVINPLPATGGADREGLDRARRNVPIGVMALDHLVSVADYAYLARAFAGIGKASAVMLSDGERQIVHLTIAGADDIPIATTSDLYRNLVRALQRSGDARQPFQVALRELVLLVIDAKVKLLPDYMWEAVEPKIRAKLLDVFSFERRELGQDAVLSQVLSVMQEIEGVDYVDVDTFDSIVGNIAAEELEQLGDTLRRMDRIVVETGRIQTSHFVERASETYASIAARYGIPEQELWRLNPAPEVGTCLYLVPHDEVVNPTHHQVKAGETFGSIAERYGIDEDTLRTWNPHVGDLWVGVCLRIVQDPSQNPTHHQVKAGETYISIAGLYGMSEEQLRELNSRPRVGQRLRIPRTIRPAQLAYLDPDTLFLTEVT
jgi:LysM repeat protein